MDCLLLVSERLFGSDDAVTIALKRQKAGIFPGIWIDLGEMFSNPSERRRVVFVFREAVPTIKADDTWTESGRGWVDTQVPRFLAELENEL